MDYNISTSESQLMELLCHAINEKNLIKFWYVDKISKYSDWRIIEPYLIGRKITRKQTLF